MPEEEEKPGSGKTVGKGAVEGFHPVQCAHAEESTEESAAREKVANFLVLAQRDRSGEHLERIERGPFLG